MNRKNQIAVVIILAILIIMFGVGMFFSSPVNVPITPSSSSTTSAASANATPTAPSFTATQVVTYVPQTPASSTPIKQGSCWTNSIAAPFRGDAWRCMVGNNISDPCFQIPGKPDLLCNINPTKPKSTSTFVLHLTKPLPQSKPVQGVQPKGNGWLVELQGGTLCTPFTGTLPIAEGGQAASYSCAPGPLGSDLMIFNIDASSSVWTARVGTLGSPSASSTSKLPVVQNTSIVPIVKVWQ